MPQASMILACTTFWSTSPSSWAAFSSVACISWVDPTSRHGEQASQQNDTENSDEEKQASSASPFHFTRGSVNTSPGAAHSLGTALARTSTTGVCQSIGYDLWSWARLFWFEGIVLFYHPGHPPSLLHLWFVKSAFYQPCIFPRLSFPPRSFILARSFSSVISQHSKLALVSLRGPLARRLGKVKFIGKGVRRRATQAVCHTRENPNHRRLRE
ncbi:hypothetical protein R3P38DRAFT_652430 [Favolaschia claudopus]|uniref:Secreted protein n=1 Tax=Favolaschia claudopus TaxID=2862362 RepID=A0AAW0E6T6_9AGAR